MFVIHCNRGWCPNLTDFYHLIFYQCHCKIHISVTVECDPSTKTLMRLRVCHCCVVYWSLALLNEGRTMMWCIVSAWNRYRCLDCEYVHGRWVLQPTDHTIQTSFKMVECLCCRSIILLLHYYYVVIFFLFQFIFILLFIIIIFFIIIIIILYVVFKLLSPSWWYVCV